MCGPKKHFHNICQDYWGNFWNCDCTGNFSFEKWLKTGIRNMSFYFPSVVNISKGKWGTPKVFALKWSLITSYCMAGFLENWHYHNQTEVLTVCKKKCNFCHFLNILILRFLTLTSIIEKIRWERSYKICTIRCLGIWKYCIPNIIKLT